MKRLLLLLLSVTTFVLLACSKDDGVDSSNFPQLNGTYKWESSLFKEYWYFNTTNKATHITDMWVASQNQWKRFGDAIVYEWEVVGNTFRKKIYGNSYDEFTGCDFEFIDADHIKIDNHLFVRQNYDEYR